MWEKLQARINKIDPNYAVWGVVTLCSAILLVRYSFNFEAHRHGLPSDFMVYLRGWQRVASGADPYVITDPSPYKYSPGILALFYLLPRIPERAWLVFSTVSVLGFMAPFLYGVRIRTWRRVGALLLGLVLAWKGILETLDYGQMELIIFAIAAGAAVLHRRQPLIAGFLAGTLPWLKLPWLLLIVPLALVPKSVSTGVERKERRLRVLLSGYFLSWFFWGAALPSLVFGSERAKLLSQSWIAVLKAQPAGLYYSDINQSFWISACRWVGHPQVAVGLVGVFATFFLYLLSARALKQTPGRDTLAWVSPWLLLNQLLSPLAWRWGSVFVAAIPLAIDSRAFRDPLEHPSQDSGTLRVFRLLLWVAIAGFWLIQLNPIARWLGGSHWCDFHQYGVITGYWLALLALCI